MANVAHQQEASRSGTLAKLSVKNVIGPLEHDRSSSDHLPGFESPLLTFSMASLPDVNMKLVHRACQVTARSDYLCTVGFDSLRSEGISIHQRWSRDTQGVPKT